MALGVTNSLSAPGGAARAPGGAAGIVSGGNVVGGCGGAGWTGGAWSTGGTNWAAALSGSAADSTMAKRMAPVCRHIMDDHPADNSGDGARIISPQTRDRGRRGQLAATDRKSQRSTLRWS